MFFDMAALLRADGSATGEAYHFALLGTNVRVPHAGDLRLVDAANNRAWIGGVITENTSTDPARLQERHEVGRDIWWRVVDYGNGLSGTVDRGTFLGFSGDAGFETSADYCAGQPWPGLDDDPPQAVDARTGPLLSGNISVKPQSGSRRLHGPAGVVPTPAVGATQGICRPVSNPHGLLRRSRYRGVSP